MRGMLIREETGQILAWVLGGAFAIAVLVGYRALERRFPGRWWMKVPVTIPLLPLLVLGAGLLPAIGVAHSVRVTVVRDQGPRFETLLLVAGSSEREGIRVAPPAGMRSAVINATRAPWILRRVFYSNIVAGRGPEVESRVAPGGVAYSTERQLELGGAPSSVHGYKYGFTSRVELVPAPDR
jgi:hypothetical protein